MCSVKRHIIFLTQGASKCNNGSKPILHITALLIKALRGPPGP